MRRNRLQWILLLTGLLAAFALRVHRLGDQNIWWDEGLSVWAVRKSFVGTTLWTASDVHPPLYFWLLWPWVRLAGESEFSARFVTVLQSMLTVALMFPLGRRLAGRRVGLGALWLLALSRFHVWWAQEMRMYTLAALGTALSTYFLVRALSAPSDQQRTRTDRSAWGAWVLSTTAALYTVYSSVLILVIQNLFVFAAGLTRSDRWRLWRRWIVAQVATLALVAPWLALAIPRMRSWSVVERPVSLGFVLELNAVLLGLGISTDVGRYRWVIAVLLIVVALGVAVLLRLRRQERTITGALPLPLGLLLLALCVALPPVTVWLLTQPRSLFYNPQVEARYFLAFAPLFYVLLAWAIAGLLRSRILRPVGLLAGVGVLGISLWVLPGHYASRYLRDELQTLARTIWAYGRPDDAVVLVSGGRYPVFLYYYDRAPAPPTRPPVYLVPDLSPTLGAETVESELRPIAEGHQRIWLAQVESHLDDPQGLARAWLAERYANPLSLHFAHNSLHLFSADPGEPSLAPQPNADVPPQYALSLEPRPALEVLGYDLLTREFRPGDVVRLGLYLQAGRPTSVTVAMVGPAGAEIAPATLDLPPADGAIRRQVEFEVTPYTPAGRYHFALRGGGGQEAHPGGGFGDIRVTHSLSPPDPAEISHPVPARLGNSIQFLGYDLSGVRRRTDPPTARPGDLLVLDLYWQTERPIEARYTVFTHLVGEAFNPATEGPVWAQDDQEPLAGDYPTDRWLPGQPLRDRYELLIPAEAPPGEYLIEVGMYLLETGERLPVSGAGADPAARRLVLTRVQIGP